MAARAVSKYGRAKGSGVVWRSWPSYLVGDAAAAVCSSEVYKVDTERVHLPHLALTLHVVQQTQLVSLEPL